MNSQSRVRRKNYFIKKSFQTTFALYFGSLILLEALLIAGLFFHIAQGTLTTSYNGADLRIEQTTRFFSVNFLLLLLITGIAVMLMGMLMFIFYSHRIAGPLYRFQKSLQELSNGELTGRIRLRQKDQLNDLGESINRMSESLDKQIGLIKKELHGASTHGTSKDSLARIKEMLDSFKTSA